MPKPSPRGAASTAPAAKSITRQTMLAKLAGSGLDESDARKLGFEFLSNLKDVPHHARAPTDVACIKIPYFNLAGKRTSFFRVRYLEDTRKGFALDTQQKALRYSQPPDTVNELYLPPIGSTDWKRIASDPAVTIGITEGEFKAACTTKYTALPTIGLGGVWCFMSSSNHMALLPMFDAFVWKGRDVYIIFDSDAATNPDIIRAENALARKLTALGARVFIGRLQPSPDGLKVGLDDYLGMKGSSIEAIMETAQCWRQCQELAALNEEVLYVRDPGVIVRYDNMQRMRPNDFVQHAYSTRIYYEEITTDKGTKLEPRSAPREWLKWPQRAEVWRVTYAPGRERITTQLEYNAWKGWGCEPRKGSVKLWRRLIDQLFSNAEPAHKRWFEQWLAYPLQNPGTKMYSAVLLWGHQHGTGKTLIGYTMRKIYGSNGTEISNRHLQGNHNGWAENRQFVIGDEISGGDKRGMGDFMKSIITQSTVWIDIKYVPSYEIPDCINWYFTSNHPDAFFLEDRDRRFFIHEVCGDLLPEAFFSEYDAALNHDPDNAFAAAVFEYLMGLDLSDFNPRGHAPMTDAKRDMIDVNRSDLNLWATRLAEDPDSVLRLDNVVSTFDLWRSEDLLQLYDPERRSRVTINGIARELRRIGLQQVNRGMGCRTESHGQCRLWVLRNPGKYTKLSGTALGKAYDDERKAPTVNRKSKY